jgi:hypothetical protein
MLGSILIDKTIAFAAKRTLSSKLEGILRIDDVKVDTQENTVLVEAFLADFNSPIRVLLTGVNFDVNAFSYTGCVANKAFIQNAAMKFANKPMRLL